MFKGKKFIHYIWACFSFSVGLWGFGSYAIGLARNPESAIFWWRIGYVGVILIPVFFTHFVVKFLELKRKWFIAILYIFGALFLFANFFDGLFIRKVRFLFDQFYYLDSPPFLYSLFVIIFFGLIVYTHIKLFQDYKKSIGIKRAQIKYFLLATIPGFLAGAFEFLPVYKIEFYPYLHLVIALSPLTVTYAILRYRLMDIRIVIRKTVIYFVSATFVYGVFFFLVWMFEKYFGGVFTYATYLAGLIIAPLFVIVLIRFYAIIQKTANKYLFFSLYSHQETIAKLTEELTQSIDLNKIVDSIVNSIKEAMQLDRAGILLIDQDGGVIKYKIAKVIGFNENNGISLVQDNFLTQHLQKTQKPLVRDELQMIARDLTNPHERQNLHQLSENMKRTEASLCLPMVISNKLIGIIVLGSKISGDAYTSDDLSLLNTLSKQAAVAVDNARLYHEIQGFNKTLQQKVDEQTEEIRGQKDKVEKAFELEKKANEELKNLDANKTDFMLITQHHLRTPLSVNAGFLDLMLSGTYGKVSPKIKSVLSRLRGSTQKEIDVVNELLDVSSYQIGKEMIHLDKVVDLGALMQETLKDLTAEAEAKKIYLKYEKKGDIPKIPADRLKLKLVLTNVIDNCIKYTTKGGVTVTMEVKNDKLLITAKDTGIGLPDEILKNLFKQTFHRGEKAQRMFAVGKGLGLFLSGKVIEGHHGKIWAESKGDGKGSAFYIELPMNNKAQEISK